MVQTQARTINSLVVDDCIKVIGDLKEKPIKMSELVVSIPMPAFRAVQG